MHAGHGYAVDAMQGRSAWCCSCVWGGPVPAGHAEPVPAAAAAGGQGRHCLQQCHACRPHHHPLPLHPHCTPGSCRLHQPHPPTAPTDPAGCTSPWATTPSPPTPPPPTPTAPIDPAGCTSPWATTAEPPPSSCQAPPCGGPGARCRAAAPGSPPASSPRLWWTLSWKWQVLFSSVFLVFIYLFICLFPPCGGL